MMIIMIMMLITMIMMGIMMMIIISMVKGHYATSMSAYFATFVRLGSSRKECLEIFGSMNVINHVN